MDDLVRQGQYERASDELARLEKENPGNAAVSFRLGFIYGAERRFPEMQAAFDRSLAAARRFESEIKRYRNVFWIQERNLGIETYEGGDLASANTHFEAALVIFPDNDESLALHHLAGVLSRTSPTDDPLESAAVGRLRDVRILRHLARAYLAVGRFQQAAAVGEQLLSLDASDASAAAAVADALDQSGDLQGALSAYDRALRLDPDNTTLVTNAALVALDLQRSDYAVGLCEHAAELHPDDAGVQAALGQALIDAKRYENARAAWERAIALQPRDRVGWSVLAGLYGQLGQDDKRQAALDRMLQLAGTAADSVDLKARLDRERASSEPAGCVRAAQLLAQARQYEAMRREIDTCVKDHPSLQPRAQRLTERVWREERQLGLALFSRTEFAPATVHFDYAAQIQPTSGEMRAYAWLARFLAGSSEGRDLDPLAEVQLDSLPVAALSILALRLCDLNRYERAAEVCERIRARAPEDAANLALLASCYDALDLPAKAMPLYREATAKAAGDPAVYHNMAALYVRRENYGQALEWLGRGLLHSPDDHDLHRLAGHVYLATGRNDLARDHLRRVIGEDPCDLPAWTKLAVACSALHLEDERRDAEQRVEQLRVAPCRGGQR